MTETALEICARLDEMGVAYERMAHAAVGGIEDCAPIGEALHAMVAKNYFLTTKNHSRFCLCLVRPNARFRTADISRQAGYSRLSFGTEAEMGALLKTYAGAVSPLGLMFDAAGRVELLVDDALRTVERLAFHPCDNCMTLAMTSTDFFDKFLPKVGHTPHWVEIHDFLQ